MAIVTLSTTLKNTMLTAVRDALDSGSGAGVIKFYTGTKPANPSIAISTQTLLGTLTLSDPCGSVASGMLTFATITNDASADASGTATWVRFESSDGAPHIDMDVSTTGGSGAVQMNTTSIVATGPISISAAALSL